MASTVKAMSFPCQQSLLDPTAAPSSSSSAQNNPAVATAAQTSASSMATAARNYATPKRVGGLAAVTPGTPGDDGLVNTNAGGGTSQQQQQQQASGQKSNHAQQQQGEGIASAPSIDETAAASSSPAKQPTARVAPAATVVKKFPIARPPSIQLGPRVSPAMRKSPPKTVFKAALPAPAGGQQVVGAPTRSSPMKPRNLDGALERGQSAAAGMALVAAAASATHQPLPLPMIKQHELKRVGDDIECPSTPGAPIIPPPPSSFLACKISPMRSTSAKKSGGVGGGEKKQPQLLVREKTPPPPVASNSMDPSKLSPGMFLSPRTPKTQSNYETHGAPRSSMRSGMTPRGFTAGMTPRGLTPGLTPTNFASDFGRGHCRKDGSMNALDASNVFAWLQSPGGQGLFSPGGGLNSLSVTNTPRGMYGFTGPAGSASKTGPSAAAAAASGFAGPRLLAPSSSNHPFYAAELEAGGDVGVNTPKISDAQRSMICISPLASKKSKQKQNGGAMGAPETPMSINFSEVFATPRLPTPRLSARRMADTAGGENDVHASPVASALNAAERDVDLDEDLNALLQLAGTTTPGGRPTTLTTFMSPLLTSGLQRVTDVKSEQNEPPSSLQLPIISGSSFGEFKEPSRQGMRRNGSHRSGMPSPPQLAIRSTSSPGSMTQAKTSLKKKSKKRKSPTNVGSPDQPQQQHPGYAQGSPMAHYPHPHPSQAHQGYYQHPGYEQHSTHHISYSSAPAPSESRYAYGTERQKTIAAIQASTKNPSPVKSAVEAVESPPLKATRKSRTRKPTTKARVGRPPKSTSDASGSSKLTAPSTTTSSGKRVRKSSAKASSNVPKRAKAAAAAISDPLDKERINAAIYAVNAVYGDGAEKNKKLAATQLRGVTMRPSGKWQAQLYYSGKSRYIGVFDSKEKASLAYEIAREVLKTDKGEEGPRNAEETDRNVALARKAAFAGINEHTGSQ